MTRTFRIVLAAFATAAAFAGAPAQGQSSRAIVTFNDPNCASWGVTQSGSNFTLTCQTLLCTVTAVPPGPLPTDNVVLTGACVGLTGSTYTWSKFAGPANCPSISSTTATANLTAPGATVSGCIYKVAAIDPVNGAGSATITLNWSTALSGPPTGCSVAFTNGSTATLPSTGGPVSMLASCTGNTNGATTWSWTKNGAAFSSGTTLSDTLPANAGTSNVTTTYAVTAANAGSAASPVTQVVTVTGTGGGGGIDMTACTAAGFTGHGATMTYNQSGSTRVYTNTLGNFGNNDAIVIAFTTPAVDTTSGNRHFSMTYAGGSPQVTRLATLATSPCSFGTAFSTQLPAATASGGPTFNINVSPKGGGAVTQLQPNTTYYITFVNLNNFVGQSGSTPSCTSSTCDAYIDSN